MKNVRLKSVLTVALLAAAFVSCNTEDDEQVKTPTVKAAYVTEIKGPATGKVDVELSYDVTYVVDNACAEFDNISTTTVGKEKVLQVEVKYPSEVCTMQVPDPKITVYKIKPTAKGTFEFKFKKSETEFLTQKVVIE